ncbi:MAG: DoxX family protein [Flavipsychrobacter sp.]
MNTALWIAQIILAITFLVVGFAKSTFSRQRLIDTRQTGVVDLPIHIVRFIGLSEISGAIGLIFPWRLHIFPILTPVAAAGLGLIMVLAAISHRQLHEPKNVRNNIILLCICLFVAIGRLSEIIN